MSDDEKLRVIEALRFLDMLVVSLDRIRDYGVTHADYDPEIIARFVRDYNVPHRAARARAALSDCIAGNAEPGGEPRESAAPPPEKLHYLVDGIPVWKAPRRAA